MSSDERALLKQELGEFLAYRHGDAVRQLKKVLDAKIALHKNDLITISEESLKAKQGRIAELMDLRMAIIDPQRAGF